MNARETAKLLSAKPELACRAENLYTEVALENCDRSVFNLHREWCWRFECWCKKFPGFEPVALVESGDWSESYEMDALHVFVLASGQAAVVSEQGCSCYEADWAEIDFYPDVESAVDYFKQVKRRKETHRDD